jgi:hypothetical protein
MKEYPFLAHLSSFAGRAVVFFFSTSVLLLFFYLLGNDQDFLDSTQTILLSVLSLSLALELVCAVYLVVFLARRVVRERKAFLVRWVLLVLSMLVCGGLLLVLRWLDSWLRS